MQAICQDRECLAPHLFKMIPTPLVQTIKRPLDLKIIAGLFILNGLSRVLDYFAWFDEAPAGNSIRLVSGLMEFVAGVGLLYLQRPFRTLALVVVWIQFLLGVAFAVVAVARDGIEAAWVFLILLLNIWEYWVLIKPRTRALFGLSQPIKLFSAGAKAIAIISIVFIGIPVVINIPDQSLRSEVKDFLAFRKTDLPYAENAFFALVGFAAREDHSAGRKIWRRYEQDYVEHQHDRNFKFNIERYAVDQPLAFKGDSKRLCRPASESLTKRKFDSDCLNYYKQQKTEIDGLLSGNQALVQRYLTLLKYKRFQEPPTLTRDYPKKLTLTSDSHYLLQARSALLFVDGKHQEALRLLQHDAVFWRMVMTGSCDLITKMVSVRYLQSDLALMLEMAQAREIDQNPLAVMAHGLKPFTQSERDMSCPMRGEFYINNDVLERASIVADLFDRKPDHWFERLPVSLVMKRNATINILYDDYFWWYRLGVTDAHQFAEVMREKKQHKPWLWNWAYLYNPGGRIFVYIGAPLSFDTYFQRLHDTDALIRLVRLQVEIRRQKIREKDIQSFLSSAPKDMLDPYTNEAMRWDAKLKTLFIPGYKRLSEDSKNIVGVPISFVY
jgi:hypothetical protein